jgi:hypothetical protein
MNDAEPVNPRSFYRPFWRVTSLWTGTICIAVWYLYHQTNDSSRLPSEVVHLHIQEGITQALLVILLTYLSFKVFTLAGGRRQHPVRPNLTVAEAAKRVQIITATSAGQNSRMTVDALLRIQSFLLAHRPICVFIYVILPAGVFFLAMLVKYEAVDQPAIFVMALVGIYVAAEHYNGLVQHEKQVDILKSHMETLNNAFGIVQGRRELYRAYSEPGTDITAVVRLFDIDPVWWSCNADSDVSVWSEYENHTELTFYNALLRGKRPSVTFVSDMPLPAVHEESDLEKADRFGHLLGLVWQCVVFSHLRDAMPSPVTSLRIRISFTYKWIHVVDDNVYQLVDLQDGATLRNLTLEIKDQIKKEKLIHAERDDILACAARGCAPRNTSRLCFDMLERNKKYRVLTNSLTYTYTLSCDR